MCKRSLSFSSTFFHLLIIFLVVLGVHCGTSSKKNAIQRQDMRDYWQFKWAHDSTVLIIGGNADFFTKPIYLAKGKYSMTFRAEGNIANNELPHFVVRLGKYLVKNLAIKEKVNSYTLHFELPEPVNESFRFTFDNDYHDSTGDRNIFLHYPIVIKPYRLF